MSQLHHHIETYSHHGKIGVMVEFRLETDYAIRSDRFRALARDVAMHIAALRPSSLEDLLRQPFVRDPTSTIDQMLADLCVSLREQVSIARFIRWDDAWPPREPGDPPRSPANLIRRQGSNDR